MSDQVIDRQGSGEQAIIAQPSSLDLSALVFAMTFPTLMAWTYFIVLAAPSGSGSSSGVDSQPSEVNRVIQWTYGLAKVVQFTFPLLYLGLFEPRSLRPVASSFRGLRLGIGFGLTAAIGLLLLYHVFLGPILVRAGSRDMILAKVEKFGAASPSGFLLLALFLSVAHSLMEEFYWRWFVFGRLQRHVSFIPAVVVSSLAFMAHHVIILYVLLPGLFLTAVAPFSICIAVGGAFWAWLYARSHTIYSPWISHLIIDAAIMAVGYDMLFVNPR